MSNYGREPAMGFLLGVVAGGVAALLLAPNSGRETRRKIRTGAYELKDTVGAKAHRIADATHAGVDSVTDAAKSQIGAVRGAVSEGRDAYRRELAGKASE